jgi:Fe-S-cluster containining protein
MMAQTTRYEKKIRMANNCVLHTVSDVEEHKKSDDIKYFKIKKNGKYNGYWCVFVSSVKKDCRIYLNFKYVFYIYSNGTQVYILYAGRQS